MSAFPEAPPARPALPKAPVPRPARPRRSPLNLTPREMDVLDLYAQGLPYTRIMRTLGLSRSTVMSHLHGIRALLNLPDDVSLRAACTLYGRYLAGDPEPLAAAWWLRELHRA